MRKKTIKIKVWPDEFEEILSGKILGYRIYEDDSIKKDCDGSWENIQPGEHLKFVEIAYTLEKQYTETGRTCQVDITYVIGCDYDDEDAYIYVCLSPLKKENCHLEYFKNLTLGTKEEKRKYDEECRHEYDEDCKIDPIKDRKTWWNLFSLSLEPPKQGFRFISDEIEEVN